MLEHVAGHPGADLQVGQAEVAVDRVALRLLQHDLQLRTAARRLAGAAVRSGATDSAVASDSISESFGSRRPFSSSDSADGARPTRSAELGEGQAAGAPQVARGAGRT